MKTWMLALSLLAVLGFTTLADAKGQGGKHGIRGKITTVDTKNHTFTITVHAHGKKNAAGAAANAAPAPQTLTVHYTVAAGDGTGATPITVNGVAGTIDALVPGKHVSIQGTKTDTDVTATAITISDHKGKKKAA